MIRVMAKDSKIRVEGAAGDGARGKGKKDADEKPPAGAKAEENAKDTKAEENGKPGNKDASGEKAAPAVEARPEEKAEPAAAAPPPEPEPAPPAASGDEAAVDLLPPDANDRSVSPQSPAPAPGVAPAGDARSLRRHRDGVEEFCLIYRRDSFLIRRQGKVGTAGQWTVTEYPSIGSAAHAYAQECSELTGDGFADLRG